MRRVVGLALVGPLLLGAAAAPAKPHDLVIRDGTVYDGSGAKPFVGDVVIDGDRIVAVTHGRSAAHGRREVDAHGLAVAPGFINMLSQAQESLIVDGRAMSDLKQGVTLEVFGEGLTFGPLNDPMKRELVARQGQVKWPVEWTTLGEYLEYLEKKGVSPNVAAFVGATTVRMHELGAYDVAPTPAQLDRMRGLVRSAMQEGALGVGSSLIYAPATYAKTPELVALASEAGQCGGMYISHMRSEGPHLLEALDELIEISRESGAPAEIYHLKQAGRGSWDKLDAVIAKVDAARARGQRITADMYSYTAGASGLDAAMPPWVQEGGLEQWVARLHDPAIRARVAAEMRAPGDGWENLYHEAGGPDGLRLIGFKNPKLRSLAGLTLAEVARQRGATPEDTAMDLVIEDGSRVGVAYALMDEANVRREAALPWVSFGSDAEAPATDGVLHDRNTHPRAYGNVARFLGRYVREEKVAPLAEAVRRLTSLPAANLKLKARGALKPGYYADVVVFDPATIGDTATFERPAQYAVGMRDVFVNGVQVLADGQHTGASPGRVVRGPGWTGWPGGGACRRADVAHSSQAAGPVG